MARSQLRHLYRPRAVAAQAQGREPADQRAVDCGTVQQVSLQLTAYSRQLNCQPLAVRLVRKNCQLSAASCQLKIKPKENLRGRRKMHRDVHAAREKRQRYALERISKTEAPGSGCRDAFRHFWQVQRAAV